MKSKFGAATKKKGGKKNDLSLLEDSLVGAAEKKVRQNQKELILAEIYQQSCVVLKAFLINSITKLLLG